MSYHAKGRMALVNDDGKPFIYEVETWGGSLVLRGVDGEWHYIEDKPPVLIDQLKKDIQDMESAILDKKADIARLLQVSLDLIPTDKRNPK